ncbi:MAG: DUF484 family protein [Deltaproteobacteria bacterium]|nr:DUF484 family protein [Deltaproteobacteria bacterium]
MTKEIYHYQDQLTLKNLDAENRRLQAEIRSLQQEAARATQILEFHDALEKDFFSAQSLEDLVLKLVNRLQIRPDIDFVSLCLTREYLQGMLGTRVYEHLLPGLGISEKLRYLSVHEEEKLKEHLDPSGVILFEKTPLGSLEIFFPEHGDEVRSHAVVTLFLRRKIIGTLNLGSIRSTHYYTTVMGPDLLRRLSVKLALALDALLAHRRLSLQKEILDHDIARASILQKDLLPFSPYRRGGLEILAYFQPCQSLGGDVYDFIPLTPQKTALLMADVSGHGISAALIAAMLKISLHPEGMEGLPLEEIVSGLNRKFCRILKQGDYITLSLGLIDPKELTLGLVRAGHPYPLLYRPPLHEIVPLSPGGPPLGIEEGAVFETMEIPLERGDVILFYTDGLTETLFSKAGPSALERFVTELGRVGGPSTLAETLCSEVARLAEDKETEDDLSLLVATVP